MPLSYDEIRALSGLLENMDDNVLYRVASAVTNGNMKPTSREKACEFILLHTESLSQLLNLKRVSTGVLLKYLHHLKESIPGTASKDEMLQRVYQKWNLPFPSRNVPYVSPPTAAYSNLQPYAAAPMSFSHPSPAPMSFSHPSPAAMSFSHPSTAPMSISHHSPAPMAVSHQAPALMLANPSYVQPNLPNNHFEMMTEASRVADMNHDPLLRMVRSKQVLREMNSWAFEEYVVGFAEVFYHLLNSNDHGPRLHGLNNSHFFGECKLKIMIKGGSEDIELEGEGTDNVLLCLSNLKNEHQLLFNPNLTEQGVRSKNDCHGLVSVAVCGTLHQQRSGPVGVFEQCFVLSTDPFTKGQYKILETVLILRSSNAVSSMTELMITSGKKSEHKLALESGSRTSESISTSAPILAIRD